MYSGLNAHSLKLKITLLLSTITINMIAIITLPLPTTRQFRPVAPEQPVERKFRPVVQQQQQEVMLQYVCNCRDIISICDAFLASCLEVIDGQCLQQHLKSGVDGQRLAWNQNLM